MDVYRGNTNSKKWLAWALVMLMVFANGLMSINAWADQGTMGDTQGHWAEKQISEWVSKGLIKGYGNGAFKPDNTITRAEFMALVNGAFDFTEKEDISYSDVAAEDWFADTIGKAKAAGYTGGYADGTMKPNNPISRQEAAVMIMKIKQLDQDEAFAGKFLDADQMSWSKGAVGAVATAGIMGGYPDGSFKPESPIKRCEAVVALSKALLEEKSGIYDKAGTYGPTSGTETIPGDVIITSEDVTLQNIIIEGNLTIDKAVGDGNVYLKKVIVKGDTYIYGGGTNSIYFVDTQTGKTYVLRDDGPVRIVASGTAEIAQLVAQSSMVAEEVDLTGKGFDGIVVDKKVDGTLSIDVSGTEVESFEVKTEGVTIKTDKKTTINTLTADAKVDVKGAGTVEKAEINASGVTFETKPKSQTVASDVSEPTVSTPTIGGGGGGGGGGSSSDTTPPSVINWTGNNITINRNGSSNEWTASVGSNAADNIGNVTITFNENIKKGSANDVIMRVYHGSSLVNMDSDDLAEVKSLLFGNFSGGDAKQLSDNVETDYDSLVYAMEVFAGETVTSVEFDVLDTSGNKLTLKLNITPMP